MPLHTPRAVYILRNGQVLGRRRNTPFFVELCELATWNSPTLRACVTAAFEE